MLRHIAIPDDSSAGGGGVIDEDEENDDLDDDEFQYDGWKSFIEWRNGIETLSQDLIDPDEPVETNYQDGESGVDDDLDFDRESQQDFNIQPQDPDRLSLFTIRASNDEYITPEEAVEEIGDALDVNNPSSTTILDPSTLYDLESWLLRSLSLNPITELPQLPPQSTTLSLPRSTAVVAVTQATASSRLLTNRNPQEIHRQPRSFSETRATQNGPPSNLWKDVPLIFFRNGIHLSVSGSSHVRGSPSLLGSIMDNTVGTLARVNGSSHPGTGHTVYNVTFKILRPQIAPFWNKAPVAFTFTRRFSEFHTLFTDLINNYKQHVPNWPEFPQRHYFGRFKPETIYQRISAFSALLNFISLHPVMFNSPPVLKFLGMESPLVEEDTVVSTEGVQRVTLTTFPEVGRGVVINKRSFSNPLH